MIDLSTIVRDQDGWELSYPEFHGETDPYIKERLEQSFYAKDDFEGRLKAAVKVLKNYYGKSASVWYFRLAEEDRKEYDFTGRLFRKEEWVEVVVTCAYEQHGNIMVLEIYYIASRSL